MRAMRASQFLGYDDLVSVDIAKPSASEGRLLVRMIGAGVTPLDHTILSGKFPPASAPLVLGNEGAGEIEEAGDPDFPKGSKVMFTGAYGVFENGTYSEYLAVRKRDLCFLPTNVSAIEAAGLPVAYGTAYLALRAAGFEPGKTVLAPAIGGSVGNAVTQVARALGAKHAISSTLRHEKVAQAAEYGFSEVIDLTEESLSAGVRRIAGASGADIRLSPGPSYWNRRPRPYGILWRVGPLVE